MANVGVRIEDDEKDAIQKLVDLGQFVDISHFVREAIREKLDPEYRKKRVKLQILQLLKDPDAWELAGLKMPERIEQLDKSPNQEQDPVSTQ